LIRRWSNEFGPTDWQRPEELFFRRATGQTARHAYPDNFPPCRDRAAAVGRAANGSPALSASRLPLQPRRQRQRRCWHWLATAASVAGRRHGRAPGGAAAVSQRPFLWRIRLRLGLGGCL